MNDELKGDLSSFKTEVSRYNLIDKQIKENEAKLKPLKEVIIGLKREKTELKNNICIYMGENDIELCNLPVNDGGGAILYKRRKIIRPITREVIRDELQRFFCAGPGRSSSFADKTDMQKATAVFDFIYDNREYKYSDILTCKR